jgi:hypothetical protein
MRLSLILVLLLCATSAAALTISPAKTILADGQDHFTVTVAGENGGVVSIRAEGDLQINFDEQQAPMQGAQQFSGTVTIPADLAPGDHEQRIIATYAPAESNGIVEVASLLIIRKRTQSPYLVLSAHAAPEQGTNTTRLYLGLENIGGGQVTPTILVTRQTEAQLPFPTLQPGKADQIQQVMTGFGIEQITIIVQGAQQLQQQLEVAFGSPQITSLEASRTAEQGPIKPVRVEAEINWNRPVAATLLVGTAQYNITIDQQLAETFYVETEEADIPVTLRVGNEERTAIASLAKGPIAGAPWLWISVLIALILLAILLMWRRNHMQVKQEPTQNPINPEQVQQNLEQIQQKPDDKLL